MARNLAGFIAGGYMLDKGAKNPAAEQATKLAFDSIEAAMLGAEIEESPNALRVPVDPGTGKAEDIDPDEAVARALARNSAGSFERFAGMVGALEVRGKMI